MRVPHDKVEVHWHPMKFIGTLYWRRSRETPESVFIIAFKGCPTRRVQQSSYRLDTARRRADYRCYELHDDITLWQQPVWVSRNLPKARMHSQRRCRS